jgi:hypothetical protein
MSWIGSGHETINLAGSADANSAKAVLKARVASVAPFLTRYRYRNALTWQ